MKHQAVPARPEFVGLRRALALAGLASVGGCAMGPTQPAFVPVATAVPMAPASAGNVPAVGAGPSAAGASAGSAGVARPTPRVGVSPLNATSVPLVTKPTTGVGAAPVVTTGSSSASALQMPPLSAPGSAAATPKPSTPVPATSTASALPVGQLPAGRADGAVRADSASRSDSPTPTDADLTLAYRVVPPSEASAARDLPQRDEPGALSSGSPMVKPAMPLSSAANFQIPLNQCWGQVTLVPTARKKVTQLVTEQARTRYRVSQARLRSEQKPVVVKDAAQTFKLEEPRYVQITESVKVQDEYTRLRVVPAEYKTIEEDVLVEPARTGLRPCAAVGARSGNLAGVAMPSAQCSYEIPARYRKVPVRTLVKPETVVEEVVPAVYKNVTRMVLADPAKVVPIEVPAATIQMPVASVEAPPAATAEQVQAVTTQLEVTEYDRSAPQLSWSRFLCANELSPDLVMAMQKGLQREGLLRGTADGKIGPQTLQAAKDFQASKGIQSDFITYQALEWLGVPTATGADAEARTRAMP